MAPSPAWRPLIAAASILFVAIAYVPFFFAVLLQSVRTRKPLDTTRWETDLRRRYSLAGLAVFALALTFPPVEAYSVHVDGAGFVVLALLLILCHAATVDYAFLRPGTSSPPGGGPEADGLTRAPD